MYEAWINVILVLIAFSIIHLPENIARSIFGNIAFPIFVIILIILLPLWLSPVSSIILTCILIIGLMQVNYSYQHQFASLTNHTEPSSQTYDSIPELMDEQTREDSVISDTIEEEDAPHLENNEYDVMDYISGYDRNPYANF